MIFTEEDKKHTNWKTKSKLKLIGNEQSSKYFQYFLDFMLSLIFIEVYGYNFFLSYTSFICFVLDTTGFWGKYNFYRTLRSDCWIIFIDSL